MDKKEKKKCYDRVPLTTRQCEQFRHFVDIFYNILHIFNQVEDTIRESSSLAFLFLFLHL